MLLLRRGAIVESYYRRPEHELFDLERDRQELKNLTARPDLAAELRRLQTRLADWIAEQGDDQRPHREPYPVFEPLPDLGAGNGRR